MLASWQPLSSQPNPPNPRFAPTATAPTLPPPAVQGYDPFAETGSPFGREVYNTGRLESLGLPADTFNRSNPATGTGFGASTLPTTTGSFSNPLPQAPPLAVVHSNQGLAPTLAVIAGAGTLATAIKKPTVFTEVLPNAFLSLQGKMGQWFSQSGDILSKQGAEAVQQTSDDLAEQGSKVLSTVTPPPSSPVPVIHHVVQQAVESDAERLLAREAAEQMQKAQEAMLQRVAMAEGRNQAEEQAFNAAAMQAQKLGVDATAIENAKTTQELHNLAYAQVSRSDAEKLAQQQALEAQLKAGKQELAEANTRHAEALKQQQQQVRQLVVEKQELTQQQSSLEASIKELELKQQQATTAQSDELQNISQQLAEQKRQAEVLEAQLKAKEEALEVAKAEKGLLEQTKREQAVVANNAILAQKQLEAQNQTLQQQHAQVLKQLEGMEREVQQAKQALANEGNANSTLNEQLGQVRKQLTELQTNQEAKVRDLQGELARKQAEYEATVASIRKNSQGLTSIQEIGERRITQLTQEHAQQRALLEDRIKQANEAVEGTQQKLATVEKTLASTQEELIQTQGTLHAKQGELAELQAKVKQTETALNEKQRALEALEANKTETEALRAQLTQQLNDLQTELATHKQQYHNAMQEVTTAYDALQRLGNLMQEGDALAKRAEALASRQAEVLQQQATEASTAQKGGLFGKAKQFVKGQVERNMHGDEAAQTRNVFSNPNAGNIDPLKAERDALMKERDLLQQRYATLKQQADEAIGKQNAFLTRQAHAEGKEPRLLALWQSNTPHPTLAPMEAVLQRLNQAIETAMPL